MKEVTKLGLKQFLRLILINVMCFFVVISFSVLSTAVFTKNIGYTAYGTSSESSEPEELYTYYYADGEDTKKQEYTDRGYTVSESKIRSTLSGTGNAVFLTVSQIFCLLILISFIYPNLWQLGTKDSNLVKFKHEKEDRLKGVKIGAVSVIPLYLGLIALAVFKAGAFVKFPVALYKTVHASFYSFIQLISGGAATVADLSVPRIILLFLLPLVIVAVSGGAYILGYNNYSLGEKLIYKKKSGGEK